MKKEATKNGSNFVDALERENRYTVLTKRGRVQILVHPSAKQLRRRGKRGWHLYEAVESDAEAGISLMNAVERAVQEMESVAVNGHSEQPQLVKGKKG